MPTRQQVTTRRASGALLFVLPTVSLVVAVGVDPIEAKPQSALAVLSTINVRNERSTGYRRELFTHWIDADGDGCNTREEVLIAESTGPPQVDGFGCTVVAGDWVSSYDNVRHEDPSDLDIDHVVALKEAWDSGAWSWSSSKRRSFANDLSDPRPLVAVTAGVNRSKGDKDPSNWLPSNGGAVCTYLSDWVAIKARWGLSMDQSEHGRIRRLLMGQCAGTVLAQWGVPREPSLADSGTNDAATGGTTGGGASAESTVPVKGTAGFRPGQFCTPVGARGTYNGRPYVCARSNAQGVPYKDSRARWRQG